MTNWSYLFVINFIKITKCIAWNIVREGISGTQITIRCPNNKNTNNNNKNNDNDNNNNNNNNNKKKKKKKNKNNFFIKFKKIETYLQQLRMRSKKTKFPLKRIVNK